MLLNRIAWSNTGATEESQNRVKNLEILAWRANEALRLYLNSKDMTTTKRFIKARRAAEDSLSARNYEKKISACCGCKSRTLFTPLPCFFTQNTLPAETGAREKREKGTGEKGKKHWVIGNKVPFCPIRAPARNDKGGRPYNCGRAGIRVWAAAESH